MLSRRGKSLNLRFPSRLEPRDEQPTEPQTTPRHSSRAIFLLLMLSPHPRALPLPEVGLGFFTALFAPIITDALTTGNEWRAVRFDALQSVKMTSSHRTGLSSCFSDGGGALDMCSVRTLVSADSSESRQRAAPSFSPASTLNHSFLFRHLRERRYHTPLRGCLQGISRPSGATAQSAQWLAVVPDFLPDCVQATQAVEKCDAGGHVLWRAMERGRGLGWRRHGPLPILGSRCQRSPWQSVCMLAVWKR
jgi:hypothetical protein